MENAPNFHRLFIAIKVSPNSLFFEDIDALKDEFVDDSIKWVDKNGIHITLHFFGNIEQEKIPLIKSIMQAAVKEMDPFTIQLKGCGFFGKMNNPSIIWTKIEKQNSLIKLHQNLQFLLQKNNFPIDEQPFHPHLTLGRVKQIKDVNTFIEVLDDFKDAFSWKQSVTEISLFESTLTPKGTIYKVLEKISF